MGKHYRHRLPPWVNHCLYVIEKVTLPILIFQLLRTLFFPTTLDVFLLGILTGIFVAFYSDWI